MNLDDCVTCGKPKDAHYGVLKSCNIYPKYRSARDVIAQGMAPDRAETEGLRCLSTAKPGPKDAPDASPNLKGTTP